MNALLACGQKGPELYPVTGKVVAADPNAVKPRGKVGADGTFTLTRNGGEANTGE